MTDFFYDLVATNGRDFHSDAIACIAYNRDKSALYVEFESGGEYVYDGVTESTYNLFAAADSLGHFYRDHISGEYTSRKGTYYLEPTDGYAPTPTPNFVFNTDDGKSVSFQDIFKNPKEEDFHFGVQYGIVGTMITAEPQFTARSEKEALEQFSTLVEKTLGADTEVKILAVTHYFD